MIKKHGLRRFNGFRVKRPPRDPEIDALVDAMRERRDLSLVQIAQRAGVAKGTVGNLDRGITRAPQHRTMARIWNGLGFEYKVVPLGKGDD